MRTALIVLLIAAALALGGCAGAMNARPAPDPAAFDGEADARAVVIAYAESVARDALETLAAAAREAAAARDPDAGMLAFDALHSLLLANLDVLMSLIEAAADAADAAGDLKPEEAAAIEALRAMVEALRALNELD